ncbi:oxidoreductase [Kocuria dechangensis]|uniref:Oxidoreductase n=1 Tax=Kocuria dechangensis TaxID=1176249 RepID=A0A917GGP6_9MICC|nr:oxidoreductase [Kocuria dechangensis]
MSKDKHDDGLEPAGRTHVMRDSHRIPAIGLGTYPMDDAEAEANVAEALMLGYRMVDTAVNYGNETGVGRGVDASGVPRSELFLTTKLPGRDHGTDSVRRSLEGSLRRLGTDYLDLYLIHWPNPSVDRYVQTWRTMLELRDEGLVRSVGVSNFTPAHIRRLVAETGETPAVNQVELHPQYQQERLRAFHEEQRIITQAWSPLGRKTEILKHEWIARIARETGRTPAQVILRWHLQSRTVPVPKTSDTRRMAENLDVFGWELDEKQMQRMRMLHTGLSGSGYDPNTHEEM